MQVSLFSILSASAAGSGEPPFWVTMMPLFAMVVIFWFLILRPQMRRQKEQANKIAGIKKGDQVLTGGGLVGKVVKVDEHYAEVEIAQGVKVKAVKSTIADVIAPTSGKPAND